MRLKIYLGLLLITCTSVIYGQEYHVDTPGTLKDVIGENANQLKSIKVTGTLNNKDIKFLHRLCWPDPKLDKKTLIKK